MNAQSKIEVPEGLALLRQEFPPHQISKLPKETKAQSEARKNNREGINCTICGGWHHPRAVHLDYVGHAALTDRLLDADPNWTWEPVGRDPNTGLPALNGGLWIKLTVCGVSRYGFGAADGKSGGDAIKEMIGDALRNAAMRFGAALDLWHKGDLHADEADPIEVEARKADEPPARTKLEGPLTSATQLKAALKQFVRSLEGCGQLADLDDLLADEETAAILAQCERDLPSWWSTGEGLPPEFQPLDLRIAARRRDLEQIAELDSRKPVRTIIDAG